MKYRIEFLQCSRDMRIGILKLIDTVVLLEDDGQEIVIQCDEEDIDVVEYELRKAKRNDDWCSWKRI